MKKLSETYKELGIAFNFPIEITDDNGRDTYCEESDGFWWRYERDDKGRPTYTKTVMTSGRSGSVMTMVMLITMRTVQV